MLQWWHTTYMFAGVILTGRKSRIEGTVDCKLYWYQNFYWHVFSFGCLKTLGNFSFLVSLMYKCPIYKRVSFVYYIGDVHINLSSIVLSLTRARERKCECYIYFCFDLKDNQILIFYIKMRKFSYIFIIFSYVWHISSR